MSGTASSVSRCGVGRCGAVRGGARRGVEGFSRSGSVARSEEAPI
jgi:hypothetical protein